MIRAFGDVMHADVQHGAKTLPEVAVGAVHGQRGDGEMDVADRGRFWEKTAVSQSLRTDTSASDRLPLHD